MADSKQVVDVKHADQMDGGVLVEFEDGRKVLFSAEVMTAMIAHGRDVSELAEE